ncbi:MAG: malonyl-CoA decarboxylase [Gammaproteobacteria bacterium]|nr:malonyl-CoA decarboxylase [Gammaproteobacteria bacterium]
MPNHWLQNVIDSIADRGRELLGFDGNNDTNRDIHALCQQLLAGAGEASGIALSQEILRSYQNMTNEEKLAFYQILDERFAPDFEKIQSAIARYQDSRSAEDLIALNAAVEAPRQELFRRLNMAPLGTTSLVAMRADLLKQLRAHPSLKSIDADLKHLLSSWFNRGFLQLTNIDWGSPAEVLEKLINYEAVHEIQGWDDLRRRLMKDRRCFAFFHPAMPSEPLIFVEVALVKGLSSEVTSLIDPNAIELDPRQADTAIFYSINNTQAGLRGISFGNFLIKQVLTELTNECPWIKVSSTLSPIPSFRNALDQWLSSDEESPQHSEFNDVLKNNASLLTAMRTQLALEENQNDKPCLTALLQNHLNEKDAALGTILTELALSFLSFNDNHGKLSDPVAMFHLSNGACMERINPYADMSEHGQSTSYGLMVNYLYDLNTVELNHEAFVTKGEIKMSDALNKVFTKFNRPALKE